MTYGRLSILCASVLLAAGAGPVSGKDWPEWCGQPSRNMAAKSDQRLPDWADCGVDNDAGEVDLPSTKNVKWVAKLGRRTTGGLSASEYARSINLLSNLPKPALSLEFRFSRRVPAMTPVDTVPTATVPDVPLLRKIWWCDCIPPDYKKLPFYPREIKGDGRGHPCDIIGTPVCWNNRVYVAIGGDPNHGGRDSRRQQ